MLLSELIQRQKDNKKVAIKHGEKTISYCNWYTSSTTLANVIAEHCAQKCNNVAIFLPNSIDYSVAYFAVAISNKVIVPIGVQSKPAEIMSTLQYCEVDIIVTSYAYRKYLVEIQADYDFSMSLIFVEDCLIELLSTAKPQVKKTEAIIENNTPNAVAIMLHTSGTTSNPKRVMLTHDNLISNVESNILSLSLTDKDVSLVSMPMHFGYCNTAQFLTHVYLGASIVIFDGVFWPKRFFEIAQEEMITNFTGVPSMLLMLLDYRHADQYNISNLRYVCFGGGNMPVEKLKLLIEKFYSVGFVQTYGQTEASPRVTALMPQDAIRKIGSVGKSISNVKLRVFTEQDIDAAIDKVGEIVVQGSNVMKGYYKQPEITENVLRNGWLHTGDLGYIDKEGYLYLVGRKKNMMISGGINIYPEEIEEVLMSHPAVLECCVVAEAHPLLDEVPVARVVLRNDYDGAFELRDYLQKHLSDYKVPIRFDFVDALPKTYNGKTIRY